MKIIVTFLIVFIFNIQRITSQNEHLKPYYVWAKSGLSLRNAPNTTADKLTIIPYKSEVSFISYTGKTLTVTEFPGFDFTSNWVKVKYKNFEGYAFLGYLSLVKPPTISDKYGLDQYLKDNYTKINTEIHTKYKDCSSEEDSCITSGVKTYKEGVTYRFWNGEGGGTDTLSIPNLNVLQAFILGSLFCPSYSDFETKYIEKPYPTIIVYRDDVGCDFSITVLGGFAIIHWSGGC